MMVTTGQTGWKSHGLKATRRLWYMIKSDRRMGYPEMPTLIIGFRVARKLAINPRLQQTNSKSCSATCREIGQDMTEYCDVPFSSFLMLVVLRKCMSWPDRCSFTKHSCRSFSNPVCQKCPKLMMERLG